MRHLESCCVNHMMDPGPMNVGGSSSSSGGYDADASCCVECFYGPSLCCLIFCRKKENQEADCSGGICRPWTSYCTEVENVGVGEAVIFTVMIVFFYSFALPFIIIASVLLFVLFDVWVLLFYLITFGHCMNRFPNCRCSSCFTADSGIRNQFAYCHEPLCDQAPCRCCSRNSSREQVV